MVAQRVAWALPLSPADWHTQRVALAHVLRTPPLVPPVFPHLHAFRHTSGDDCRASLRSAEPFPPRCHATCRPQRANCCVLPCTARYRCRSTGCARLHGAGALPPHPSRWSPPCQAAARGDNPSHLSAAASPSPLSHTCMFHPGATSPTSRHVAPPFPVHATCSPDASQGGSRVPTTACARVRTVVPAPAYLSPPQPRAASLATFNSPASTAPRPAHRRHEPRARRNPTWRNVPHPLASAGTLGAPRTHVQPPARAGSPPHMTVADGDRLKGRWQVAATACSSRTSSTTV